MGMTVAMRRSGWSLGASILLAFILAISPSACSAAGSGGGQGTAVVAQAAPGSQPGQPRDGGEWGGRISAETDLVWLLAGLMDMERDRKLALTRDQAAQLLPLFDSLVQGGLIQLESDQRDPDVWTGWGAPGSAGVMPVPPGARDPARLEEARARRDAREQAIHEVIERMEKVLSARQIAYVDSFDFDPQQYGLGLRGPGQRLQPGQGPPVGLQPSQQQIKQFVEAAREARQRLVEFYRKFQAFLRRKAGVSN